MKKLEKIGRLLGNGVVTLLLLVGLCVLVLRGMGFQFYAVQTASMEGTYPVGTLLIVEPIADVTTLEPDTVISFVTSSGAIVTHRVVENDVAAEQLYTKGDANETADAAPVAYANVLGSVQFGVPYIGKVSLLFQRMWMRILLFVLLGVVILYLLLGALVPWTFKKRRRKK